jgi:lysophospholipase
MKVFKHLVPTVLFFCSVSLPVFLSQNLYALSETNYATDYASKIVPLIQKMSEGTFNGSENATLHYRTYLQPKASNCLIILPGRTEPVEKYAEIIYDLLHTPTGKNLDFYLLDHRGQGQSSRLATPSDLGHVDHFQNYVSDIGEFIHFLNLDKRCEHKFLLAHSMGAGIAMAYLLKNPTTFERVVLTSPMLKIITKPYSYGAARSIVELQTLAGRGAKFAINQKSFNPNAVFADNSFTTSPERFAMTMKLYETYPLAKLGGVSNRWILEVMKGTNQIRSRYHEINIPMRVFTAGIETYSEPEEMNKLCSEAANCKLTHLETSKHEVMMDKDANRNIVMSELVEFFH